MSLKQKKETELDKLLKATLTIPKEPSNIEGAKRDLLKGLQGNILRGHGRFHAAHVFVQFGHDVGQLRKQIGEFAGSLTSAYVQEKQVSEWRKFRRDGGTFHSLLLSYSGYQRLGVPEDEIPDDPIFRSGMRSSDETYFRWSQHGWNQQFGERVDAMGLIADSDLGRLQERIGYLKDLLTKEALADSFKIHWSAKRVNEDDEPIEWFGFRDGISQPVVMVSGKLPKDPTPKWPTFAPLNLVLSKEPGHERCGSYVAFHKLEQNVRKFWVAMNRLAEQLGAASVDEVAALAVGRTRRGDPLIGGAGLKLNKLKQLNNFDYLKDKDGHKCPFHAHIRKVNPRGEIYTQEYPANPTPDQEKELQILRRGTTYDDRSEDEKRQHSGEPPESGVGLLFISYQRELAQFLAKLWMARSDNFVRQRVGPDPLLARGDSGSPQVWRRNGLAVSQRLTDFVTLLGGEYFFAPSIPFLKGLGQNQQAVSNVTTPVNKRPRRNMQRTKSKPGKKRK